MRGSSRILAAVAASAILMPVQAAAQASEFPDALERLERLAGTWETDRVEFLNEEGEVVRVSSATTRNDLQMGGRVMVHRGALDDPPIETRGWYYWNPDDGRLHMGSVSSGGRYDEFVGGWQGDRLVMVTLPSPAYGGRLFRMTQSEITEMSFLEVLEVSSDGGATWRVSNRQRMRRSAERGGPAADAVAAGSRETDAKDAPAILEALDAYTGHWRSRDRTDAAGAPLHFEYDLGWIDPGRTIARMVITRHGSGEQGLVFEGFKGLEPDAAGIYYVAAGPSGRGARGDVVLEGENLVTRYEGWTPDGDVVRIRDVFGPVRHDAFVSRTYLRSGVDEEWRLIDEDEWRRTGPSAPASRPGR